MTTPTPEAVAALKERRDAFDELVQSMADRDMTETQATLVKSAAVARNALDLAIATLTALMARVEELEAHKLRLEHAIIRMAAPDYLTQAERDALHDFIGFLRDQGDHTVCNALKGNSDA